LRRDYSPKLYSNLASVKVKHQSHGSPQGSPQPSAHHFLTLVARPQGSAQPLSHHFSHLVSPSQVLSQPFSHHFGNLVARLRVVATFVARTQGHRSPRRITFPIFSHGRKVCRNPFRTAGGRRNLFSGCSVKPSTVSHISRPPPQIPGIVAILPPVRMRHPLRRGMRPQPFSRGPAPISHTRP